jgi:hypothetical protein
MFGGTVGAIAPIFLLVQVGTTWELVGFACAGCSAGLIPGIIFGVAGRNRRYREPELLWLALAFGVAAIAGVIAFACIVLVILIFFAKSFGGNFPVI